MLKEQVLITCHRNADFDALASLIGAQALYPESILLFPGTQEKHLQSFYDDVLQYLFHFVSPKEVAWDEVQLLVVVDTRQADRIPHVQPLLDRLNTPFEADKNAALPALAVHIWDHHPPSENDIQGHFTQIADVGATATLLTEAIRAQKTLFNCQFASILGLGIYADTGSFGYTSTTSRDFEAAGWLLSQGMDLGLTSMQAQVHMTKDQLVALNEMLQNAEIHELGGHTVVLAVLDTDAYFNDFALLAVRLMEIQPCQVLFALGLMEDKIQTVARSRLESVDVSKICSMLGGGGHRYAASASVKDKTLSELKDFILTQVSLQANPEKTAETLMSSPVVGLEEEWNLDMAESMMGRYGLKAAPVFRTESRICVGWLDYQMVVKAHSHGLGQMPLTIYMQRTFQAVPRNAGLQQLMDIIVGSRQRLVPVVDALAQDENDRDWLQFPVIGVVTRTDLIRIFMDDGDARLPMPRQRKLRERNVAKMLRSRLSARSIQLLEFIGKLGTRMGLSVYVVGGLVRDLLMEQRNFAALDIDLVVEGQALHFARALKKEFGGRVKEHTPFLTALLIFTDDQGQEHRIDVATARLEYYERPGAMPTVELSSIKMDLSRRDFTINAMAVKLNEGSFGNLVDFFDGQNDIKRKLIRPLHALSFVEDPTRILRAVRFEQRYEFRLGQQCERLIKNALDLHMIQNLSGRRVVHELELVLTERNALDCFLRMQEMGLLAAIHPQLELPPWKALLLESLLSVMEWYTMLYLEEKPDKFILLLMAFFRNSSTQDTQDALSRLDLVENRHKDFLKLRHMVMSLLPAVEKWHSAQSTVSVLCALIAPMPLEGLLYLIARVEDLALRKQLSLYVYKWRMEKADISGEDLRNLGLAPGPIYGRILKRVLAAKLDGKAVSREEQLELARQFISTP